MNVPLWLHLQTTITEDLVWALHLVSLCRHGSLCFAQPFKMHEMSKSIERTVINRHAFLFIFCFKRRFCAEDAGRTRGTRVQTCRLQYNRLLPTPIGRIHVPTLLTVTSLPSAVASSVVFFFKNDSSPHLRNGTLHTSYPTENMRRLLFYCQETHSSVALLVGWVHIDPNPET